MLRALVFMLLLVGVEQSWSSTEARLLSRSSSGTTALFNLGNHDNLKVGDYAIIVKPTHDMGYEGLRLVPAAKARNVKINSDTSIWVLYRIYDPELLVNGDLFLILSESSMLNGRIDPGIARTTVIAKKNKTSEQTSAALSGDSERLSKLKNKYYKAAAYHDPEYRSDGEFELFDLEEWEKVKGARYRSAIYKSPHQDEFRREMRLSTFEKMVTAYLDRVNEPEFNYDVFYAEQMKDRNYNEFREKSNFMNEYRSFVFDQAQKKTTDAKLYRKLLERGERWSEDLSDEELESTLKQVSVLQEKDRKIEVMSKPKHWNIFFDYGLGLINTQTGNDPGHRRGSLNAMELSVELIPFLKRETLGKFSIEASVRSNKTASNAKDYNVDVNERSAALGMNWYPLTLPSNREEFLFYTGVYVRGGYANLDAPTVGESGNYTLTATPGVKMGIRYSFYNNVSLRIGGSVETLNLEEIESNKVSGRILPGRKSMLDAKTSVGIGYSF